MPPTPPTPGNPRRPLAASRLTHTLVWLGLVLAAPVLLMQVLRDLPPAFGEPGAAVETAPHTFRFDASGIRPAPRSVALAGTMNGWSKDATPMTPLPDKPGVWETTVQLPHGVTFYKFVLDGERWTNDPASDKDLEEPDGHGGMNSAVLIGPDFRTLPKVRPGEINVEHIRFDPADARYVNVADASHVRFQITLQAGDATRVFWNLIDDDGARTGEMASLGAKLGFETFAGVATVARGERVRYWFTIEDDTTKVTVGPEGPRRWPAGAPMPDAPQAWSLAMTPTFQTPDWARHAVWYQIFPERFRNGDPKNDPGDFWYERLVPWTADWWTTKPGETPGDENFYRGAGNVWQRRYGGDLAGVREKLPYLRELGVNAIYFNPIFEAESMHKYDTADFRHVDDNFGVRDEPKAQPIGVGARTPQPFRPIGNRPLFELDGTPLSPDYRETDDPATWKWTKSDLLFLDFLQEARRQGFRVVIDGVFNHVGRAHPFFQDVLANGRNSKYADWFAITDWGDPANWRPMDDPMTVHGKPGGIRWIAWDGPDGHLPAFRKDPVKGLAPGPYQHIMAITRRWLAPGGDRSRGIDGWRLDVPNDIPHPFWVDWRKVVKESNPDAYITGEIWTWAQPWLAGDQFDAVMNYQFAMAAQEFFVNRETALPPSAFNRRALQVVFSYPLQVALVQQNLFDSHDTDRLASMFVNPDRPYDGQNRLQDNAAEVGYDRRAPNADEWRRLKQAVAFQMTFVGAPMIYYGNEAGMFSPDDPSNRMPFWWKDVGAFENPDFRFNDDVFAYFQKAVAVRNALEPLRTGGFRPVLVDDDRGLYGFAREGADGRRVFVVFNRSDRPTVAEVEVGEIARPLYDYLGDAAEVTFADDRPDARPVLRILPGAEPVAVSGGKARVEMDAFSAAVLAP